MLYNVLAIDPSLTHTAGWHACGPLTGLEYRSFAIQSERKGHAHAVARLAAIRNALLVELAKCSREVAPGIAFVEGYAFGAKCAREALGELGGQVRLALYEFGWQLVIVPPTVLKAFVCGKGNAPKELMMLNVFKQWGYEAPDNNAADAYGLMRLGLAYVAWQRGEVTSKATTELLRKIEPLEARAV